MARQSAKKAKEHRSLLANELLKMEQLLSQHCSICRNPGVIRSAVNSLLADAKQNTSTWEYKVSGLLFEVPKPKNTLPSFIPNQLDISLDVNAAGEFDCQFHDPFTSLAVNIRVAAKANNREHIEAWHLDRHEDGGNPPECAHPLYHIQRGGRVMKHIQNDVGLTMIVDPPRLAHPPIEVILGIDYVLSQYAGKFWQALRTKPEYLRLVGDLQKRLWQGYTATCAVHFDPPPGYDVKVPPALQPTFATL
ncbi:MAG: hypothetical protein RIE84_08480 [Parvibaculum sp.]|uniref:hypothetical protein n=1 Tax=Parvibaculum sp. TaxID=2024848 RepID=UPI0032EB17A2